MNGRDGYKVSGEVMVIKRKNRKIFGRLRERERGKSYVREIEAG